MTWAPSDPKLEPAIPAPRSSLRRPKPNYAWTSGKWTINGLPVEVVTGRARITQEESVIGDIGDYSRSRAYSLSHNSHFITMHR